MNLQLHEVQADLLKLRVIDNSFFLFAIFRLQYTIMFLKTLEIFHHSFHIKITISTKLILAHMCFITQTQKQYA